MLLTATLVGRLPTAMAPLALLLAARADHAGAALGALLAALYALCGAVSQPLLGRAVDRRRLAGVALAAATVAGTAFTALAVVGTGRDPLLSAALVAVAGLATPPLEAGLRAMWPRLVAQQDQQAAFALDATAQEAVYVAGPALATVLCQLASPALALLGCAILGLAGTALVASRQPARVLNPVRREAHWLGPLRSPGLLVLLGAATLLGASLGSFNVYALAAADHHGAGWLAGALPAALSLGSLVGGIMWARLAHSAPAGQLLRAVSVRFAAPFALFLLTPEPALAVAAAALPGLFLAPWLATAFQLGDRLAPQGTATEAAAWLVAVIGLGGAAGTALAGQLSTAGPVAVAALTLASAVAAALTLAVRR
ncbi:MFS transporter [Kitasatospora sp. YST-16]|uniref:MFS transporter n=1 Tax=Kitasatospora sp. YST-16 TaxID=2998080 RepID=UPI0022838F43|nr:MFS transporter [Kitasatospora sp. YST-16]WAL74596.1 MFS transporter [Kitasatospora sp. YST-16]WNW40654.1 MFS transporter [Streptomyces sp. Li-HN-5-13]